MRVTDQGFDYEKLFYLAGPMTDYPNYNYDAFAAAEVELEGAGILVRSPHKLSWPEGVSDPKEIWRAMMRKALGMLIQCDGIILMRGWIQSKGASTEYNLAVAMEMPAYFMDGKYLIALHDPNRPQAS